MRIIVLDVETTSLYNKKETDLDKQPYIVQFAGVVWTIDNKEFIVEKEIDLLFKPPISIPYNVSEIHHIYDIDVKDKQPIDEDLIRITQLINEVDVVIWHNIEFDLNCIKVEIQRLKNKWELIDFQPKKIFDTMNESINWCRLPKKSWVWFKRPKLQELCKKALWEYFTGAHNALQDVKFTLKAFLKLYKDWIFNLEEREQQWLFD